MNLEKPETIESIPKECKYQACLYLSTLKLLKLE